VLAASAGRKRFSQRNPVKSALSLKYPANRDKLGGPPDFRAVLKLNPRGDEVVASVLDTVNGIQLNFQVPGSPNDA